MTALPSRRGLPVDLLVKVEPVTVMGIDLSMDPDTVILPGLRSANLLREPDPVVAKGGRLYRLHVPEDQVVGVQLGQLGMLSLGSRDGLLRLGLPTLALPFAGGLKPYTVAAEARQGGGRLLTLDLPRGHVARFKMFRIDVAVRIPA